MHELSIARDLIDLVVEEATRAGASRVVRVKLRVGALAGVVPPALRTAFDAARIGTPIAEAALDIEHVPAAIYCARCACERPLEQPNACRCSVCGTPATATATGPVLITGTELELSEIEVA